MATLNVINYDVLYQCLESASYLAEDIIIDVDERKININVKNQIARLSIESFSVSSTEKCQIVLSKVQLFMVAIRNAQESIKDPLTDKITIEVKNQSKLIIKTNNSKTSIHQADKDIIKSYAPPIKELPASMIDFSFSRDAFKKLSSSLIYIANTEDARIELSPVFEDIKNKSLMGAKVFAANTPLSNYSVIDIGEIRAINSEKMPPIPYQIILDFDRVNLISRFATQSNSEVQALAVPALLITKTLDTSDVKTATTISFICSILK